jgi:hypothetical protein
MYVVDADRLFLVFVHCARIEGSIVVGVVQKYAKDYAAKIAHTRVSIGVGLVKGTSGERFHVCEIEARRLGELFQSPS